MKLFGIFTYYKEKDIEAARQLYNEAKASYELALNADTVSDFVCFWYLLNEKNKNLSTYEAKISPEHYNLFTCMRSKESEFQWRLRDAVERSALSAIRDMAGEYRNNKLARADIFAEDIDIAIELSDTETAQLIHSSISQVADIAGIQLPVNQLLHEPRTRGEYRGIDAELLAIDLMEGHEFEQWCASTLRSIGYINVEVTPGSGDQGVDILAQKDGIKYAIQCKCYAKDLGNGPIQEVNAGKTVYRCHIGAVMTNRYFTKGAKNAAEANGILLWDRDWIIKVLGERNKRH